MSGVPGTLSSSSSTVGAQHRHDASGVPADIDADGSDEEAHETSSDEGGQCNISSSPIPEGWYKLTFLGKLISALPLDCRDARTIMLGVMLGDLQLAVTLISAKLAGDPFLKRGSQNHTYRHYGELRE